MKLEHETRDGASAPFRRKHVETELYLTALYLFELQSRIKMSLQLLDYPVHEAAVPVPFIQCKHAFPCDCFLCASRSGIVA